MTSWGHYDVKLFMIEIILTRATKEVNLALPIQPHWLFQGIDISGTVQTALLVNQPTCLISLQIGPLWKSDLSRFSFPVGTSRLRNVGPHPGRRDQVEENLLHLVQVRGLGRQPCVPEGPFTRCVPFSVSSTCFSFPFNYLVWTPWGRSWACSFCALLVA